MFYFIRSGVSAYMHPHLVVISELFVLLQSYDIQNNHKQTRDKKQLSLKFRFQFIIGGTCRQRTFKENSSFCFKYSFLPTLVVYSIN